MRRKIVLEILCFVFAVGAHAQEVIQMAQGKEVIILPASYNTEKGFVDIDAIKPGKVPNSKNGDFKTQLDKAANEVLAKGGNVLQLSRIDDHKQEGCYRFWGEAYRSDHFDELKARTAAQKKKNTDAGYATIVLYRPGYTGGFNDSLEYDVVINDTLKLHMQHNTKFILSVRKEGPVRITVQHKNFSQHISLDPKKGDELFVRNYVSFPGTKQYISSGDLKVKLRGYSPYLEQVNELQGSVESGMVTQAIINKKI